MILRIRDVARRIGLNRILGRWIHSRGYEDRFGSALLSAVRPGDTVWDIGANVGLYSDLFVEAVGIEGEVIAFEPTKECFEELTRRFAAATTLHSINAAVGANDGTVVMEVSDAALAPTHRVMPGKAADSPNSRIVSVRSARSLCQEYPQWFPNVVKIDVEGHEGAVIQGFGELLGDSRLRTIGVEVHFGLLDERSEKQTPATIERSLCAAGFAVRWTDPSHLVATRRA
ncbi:MAG: FkbM family methyltransferase [Planctomycetota bacterium]